MSPAVFLVTGLDATAMTSVVLGLLVDQPTPVVVSHTLDDQGLVRTVSDLSGTIERELVHLDHDCLSCAIRHDVVPTLERLVREPWETVIACLPAGADAMQVCRALAAEPGRLGSAEVSAVLAALDSSQLADDLTGPDLLGERGLDRYVDDDRGVAEVLGALIEHADVVAVCGPGADPVHLGLVRALAWPGAVLVDDWTGFDSATIRCGVHDHAAIEAWTADVPGVGASPVPEGVWRLVLHSDRPMHPARFREQVETLGSGQFRTRGAFWVPTRPQTLCQWDGGGGQLSIGTVRRWQPGEAPCSRLVMTGLLEHGDPRAELQEAFCSALVSTEEIAARGHAWEVSSDGLEPWLGRVGQLG